MVLWLLCEIMGRLDTYGVELTPEIIAELLDKGEYEEEMDDGSIVYLTYDRVPRSRSEGWNE